MHRSATLWVMVVALLCLASVAMAEETVVGKWKATIETPRGTNEIIMEFTGTDEDLQGTWSGPRGTNELADVKMEAGMLTFKRHLSFQGNEVTIEYECTLDGDTMNGKMITPRGERQFTAKRAS